MLCARGARCCNCARQKRCGARRVTRCTICCPALTFTHCSSRLTAKNAARAPTHRPPPPPPPPPDKKRFSFSLSSASPRTNTPHYHRRSPIADRQKKVMARTKQTNRRQQPPSQFGGKQPRTNPAASPPPPPPQKLHECLAIIEQKTEPHYKAVACIDNKNINRVPKKELCKSVEAGRAV